MAMAEQSLESRLEHSEAAKFFVRSEVLSPYSTATTQYGSSPSSAFSLSSLDRSDSALSTASFQSSRCRQSSDSAHSLSDQDVDHADQQHRQPLGDVTNLANNLQSLQLPRSSSSSCHSHSTTKALPPLPPPFCLIRHPADATLAYEHYCTLFDRQGHLRPVYDPASHYLRHRTPLLNWLMECCETELGLEAQTVSCTVALLDYFCTTVPTLPAQSLQLIALCSVLLAAKYCECESDAPSLSTLLECAGGVYSVDQLRAAELWCLQQAGWSVGVITATHFIHHACQPYSLQLIITEDDAPSANHPHLTAQLERCIRYLDHICLRSALLCALPPPQLAASIVCAARYSLGLSGWHDGLPQVLDCARDETMMWVGRVLDWHHSEQQQQQQARPTHHLEQPAAGMEL